jgi:hypothetical protein
MKKIIALPLIILVCYISQAQVSGSENKMTDSARHFMHRHFNRNSNDSLHHSFGNFRDGALNRSHFGSQGRMNAYRSFGRRRNEWVSRNHIHYSIDQRKQIRTIAEVYRKKSEDLYKQDKITLGEYKSQLLALQKERKTKMQELLTPEQKTEMEKWKKHVAEEAQVRAAANLERMKIKLGLNDEQAAKIKSEQTSLRSQLQAIHQNDNLLPYQKKEQMKALLAKRDDVIKSVLTPDQLSQFEKIHAQRFRDGFDRSNSN